MRRADSQGNLPAGVKIAHVNYDDEASLIAAFQDQQFLVITLSVRAPPDTHSKIVKAAAKAGVPYVMPNCYGFDVQNKTLAEESLVGATYLKHLAELENLGVSYIVMTCGFWYEWSLALGEPWFGFDIKDRKVTFFDDGNTRMSVSTWQQCGKALAALLSLPESVASPAISQWKNKSFYIASFSVSQRDMLDSLHRVNGTTDKEWNITYEPTAQRYKDGKDEMQKGIMTGMAKAMYARGFFPNGDGNFESSRGLANDLIGLPKDSLDEATKRVVEMVESGWNPFAQ